jgi:hypothetical protein
MIDHGIVPHFLSAIVIFLLVNELRRMLHQAGIGKQGRSRSPEGNATALLQIHHIQQLGHSFDVSVKCTAATQLVSPSRLREVMNEFQNTGTLPISSTEHRGRGNPEHPLNSNNFDLYGPSLEAELLIHQLVRSQKTSNKTVTSTTIAAEQAEKLFISLKG